MHKIGDFILVESWLAYYCFSGESSATKSRGIVRPLVKATLPGLVDKDQNRR